MGWRRDGEEGRAVPGPLSSWDPKLYNQLFFRVHTDLRKCTVGISSYPGDLRQEPGRKRTDMRGRAGKVGDGIAIKKWPEKGLKTRKN